MTEKELDVRLPDGSISRATLQRRDDDPACWLRLVGDGIDETSTGADYFESFVAIRRRLARRKMLPLCYASSRNVCPSGAARDMARGLAAYKLKMGAPAEELVHIFDCGPDVEAVPPDEQKAFSAAWFTSLPRR